MTDWPVKTLGDVCEVIAGQSPEGKFYNKEGKGVPFYQGKKDFSERVLGSPTTWTTEVTKLSRPGDILMSVRAPVGPVNLCPIEACIGRGLAAIRPSSKTDTDFIFYYLESIQSEIAGTEGAVFASINKAQIADLRCPVPPLDEQKRIVELLDAATARVTELTACYEQARTHANNLFTSALRELMEKCDNTTEMTLSEICIVDWGNTDLTKKSYRSNGKYLAVSATGPDGRIGHAEHKAFTPVLSAIGARCGRMFLPEEDFTAIKNTITLTPIAEVASGKYIFFLFEHLSLPIRGAAQPFISKGDIEKFEVSVPSLDEQKSIVARLDSMRAKTLEMVAAYDAKLTAAKNLRQSILESAFEGKL